MKIKNYTILVILGLMTIQAVSQTSAGKCWYIDYDEWNINQPELNIDCGNSDMFNTGDELTLELWIRAYTFGENRKIMGKIDSDGSVFNNGYVLGFQNLNVYTELWNPTLQQIPYANTGPMKVDSAFVHIATTYSSSTMKMSDYINGELVAAIDVFPPNPIVANDANFLIGCAPWGTNSYQFYGALDEVRVWNKARTEEELAEYMFKELKGDEEGLVAYYNFNAAHDSIVPDVSMSGNTGTLRNSNEPSWSWADSYIPVGDERMYEMVEPVGAWCGRIDEEFYIANSESGLSVFTDIQEKEFEKYLVFGHNTLSGTSTDFAPNDAPADFLRLNREWYLNKGGNLNCDVFVNLSQAAGGGEELPTGENAELYVLMHRNEITEQFVAITHPSQVYNENLIFNDLYLQDGYYCVGYASSEIPIEPWAVNEQRFKTVYIAPNPAHEVFTIRNADKMTVELFNSFGQVITNRINCSSTESFDVSELDGGLYFVQLKYKDQISTRKLIIR